MKVETKGFTELSQSLKMAPTFVKRNINKAIKNSVLIVQLAAKQNAPVGATKNLRRSIITHVDEQAMFGVVGLDAPGRQYGIFVEKGTKPHWVPIEALKRWAAQRGLNPYAVQAGIAKKGTRPQPFMHPAYDNNKKFIRQQFTMANKNIVRSLKNGN